ncbi:MAG: toxin YhaV [Sphingomonadales bacterium]|jgi:toxin YhaV|nr:toxin YhaV [Sphingomonadales bacterium]
MAVVNGWTLYEHPAFARQREKLQRAVEALRAKDPEGYRTGGDAKLLAAIARLTLELIPADPGVPQFRQGGTLSKARKHWFRAKFGNGRYRLFYQFSSRAKVIIYAWVNDESTLRTYGGKRDAYAVFKMMLDKGNPPDSWNALAKAVGLGARKGATGKTGKR